MPRVFTRRQHRVRQVRYTLVRARARITVFSRKGHRIPMRIGFDNDQYIALQAEHIRNRIDQFGGKLYLEFGGKPFDD